MQMDDLRRPRLLMEVVYVLREHRHIIVFLHPGDELVTLTRLCVPQLTTQFVVELRHERRVSLPPFMTGDLLHRIVLPKTIVATESLETALYRHAGTCQKYYFLLHTSKYFPQKY